jgi:hypothetical protein
MWQWPILGYYSGIGKNKSLILEEIRSGFNGEEVAENCITRSFVICAFS